MASSISGLYLSEADSVFPMVTTRTVCYYQNYYPVCPGGQIVPAPHRDRCPGDTQHLTPSCDDSDAVA